MAARARRQADDTPAEEGVAVPVEAPAIDPAGGAVALQRATPGPRFLAYFAGFLLLVGLFQRSDLLSTSGEAAVGGATLLLALVGLAFVFRLAARPGVPVFLPSHYLVPTSAVAVAAGISYLAPDWRLHFGAQAMMALVLFNAGYVTLERLRERERPGQEFLHDASAIIVLLGAFLAILSGVPNLYARILLLAVASFVMAYESFHRATGGDQRAPLFALMVAQVVPAIAFAFLSSQVLDTGRLSGVLLVLWYLNRGIVFHMLKATLTRSIFIEYAVGGGAVFLALAATTLLNR